MIQDEQIGERPIDSSAMTIFSANEPLCREAPKRHTTESPDIPRTEFSLIDKSSQPEQGSTTASQRPKRQLARTIPATNVFREHERRSGSTGRNGKTWGWWCAQSLANRSLYANSQLTGN